MGTVIRFPRRRHACSQGQRSERNSERGTPVASSIGNTNSAGTPFLDRRSQYQTCDWDFPIRSANAFCPPASSQARSSASVDMESEYPKLGKVQPKTLYPPTNKIFGNFIPMGGNGEAAKALGKRVRARRLKLVLSQGELAEAVGMKQQGIDNIEHGSSSRPRLLREIAKALQTSEDWLIDEIGPEDVFTIAPQEELLALVNAIAPQLRGTAVQFLRRLAKSKPIELSTKNATTQRESTTRRVR